MSYIKASLAPGENIVAEGVLSRYFVLYPAIFWTVLSVVFLLLPLHIFGMILFIPAFRYWSRYLTTEIAITDRRFIFKTGLIARRVNEVSVRRIEGASLDQSVLGRMMGVGTVVVRGTGQDHVYVRSLQDPIKLQNAVNLATHMHGR